MESRAWEIGICGTFDVGNYGDLLFPLLAELELRERLGAVTLHRFSYNAKSPPDWPYAVTSVAALPEMIHRLDGLLIGGGFLIRFDKQVAPGYGPPSPDIHHPCGYWLTPALLALQHNVPLVWNAPGMHCNESPAWASPLLEMALTQSRYISVRDDRSRQALAPLTAKPISVVPDTGFRMQRLLDLAGPPSAEFARLRGTYGLDGPYIVIQATLGLEGFAAFLKEYAERLRNLRFLVLPIGPALGERHEIVGAGVPGVVRLAEWPHPHVIAELIGRSEAVIGHSYHLFISALTAGVPIFTRQDLSAGKYSALQHCSGIFALPADGAPDLEWFLVRLGRKAPSTAVVGAAEAVGAHWDRIADALRAKGEPTAPVLNRFWQSVPAILEQASFADVAMAAAAHSDAAAQRQALDEARARLAEASAEAEALRAQLADMMTSRSWRLTMPLRFAGRHLLKHGD
ncbi:MAG: polysaccharide pyruvyl transferase family protein [Acidobacteria bacterium]|nr:polysaccharide pyruvyl transferase family protein [Acidobacteriota bacterium]